ISREWKEGEEIVVTRLDHDANVTPWVLAAQDRGVRVNWVDFDVEDGTLRLDDLHGPIDVQNLDCDFLVPSAYNLEEPHVTQARMELMQAKQYGDLTPASSAA
ncbi:MAG: aminotransferase class V-fold PLP-dependent enzyme, partial [Anaerolineales bacterium]|nr:aminotransferase class V-fold PLP-dependent enzyme [Anaerolineales bacterium]